MAVRPWHLRWGATTAEVLKSLPGDERVPHPRISATHAITINAEPADVWPWLVQMGQNRGGFYSYTWIENLMGCRIQNADRIVPEWQSLKEGDGVRLHPNIPAIPVVLVRVGQVIVMHGDSRSGPPSGLAKPGSYVNTSWAFFLESVEEHRTRLIERFRADYNDDIANTLFNRIILEPGSFIMERRMLLGIKERAERTSSNRFHR